MAALVLNPILEEEEEEDDDDDVIFTFTPQKIETRRFAPRAPHKTAHDNTTRYDAATYSSDELEEEREIWVRKRFFATKIDIAAALQLSIDGLWDMQEMRTDPKFVQYIDEAKMRRIQRMFQFKQQNGFADEDDFHYICSTVRFFILASYDMELHLKQSDMLIDAYEQATMQK